MKFVLALIVVLSLSASVQAAPTCGPNGCTVNRPVARVAHSMRHVRPLRAAARLFWRTSPFVVFGGRCCR